MAIIRIKILFLVSHNKGFSTNKNTIPFINVVFIKIKESRNKSRNQRIEIK